MRRELPETKRLLSQVQDQVKKSLNTYDKNRDLPHLRKFFPDIDTAQNSISEALKVWPDFDSLSDADAKEFGKFLNEFCKDILEKIQSKA